MPAERGLGLRRNGKKQSCEPCRKGKLACDHATPHCGRCVRRKQTEKCFYHPAPMTRPKALPTPHGTPSAASDQSNNQEHSPRTIETSNVSVPPTAPNTSQSLPWLQNQVPEVLEPLETTAQYIAALPTPEERKAACIARRMTWRTSRFQKSRRYQGPTSFTAVFSEGQSKFSENLLDIGEDDRPHPAMWPFNAQPLLGRRRPGAPNIRINETRKALWNVPSRDVCNRLLETFESFHNESMNEVIIRHSIATLWTTFEGQLSEPRTEEKLDEITKVLLKNEERPLPPAPTDGVEWLDTFTGPNIRFESLGLLFCFFGMAYHMLQDLDPLFESHVNKDDPNRIHGRTRDRRQTAWRMSECADMCLKMTDCSETINELVVALLLNLLLLETNCAGEESYKIRRRHGDLVTATIAVGLHRIPEYGINGATTAGEYIRRLFAVVYIIDKRNSSSNGTPPLLNRLYCNHRSAFELTNEELFLPQNRLNQVISELDPNGWKLTTDIWNTSLHRALFLFSVIRDEILGLSLGVDVEVSASRIEDLYQRCHSTYADLPERLHYYLLDTTPKKSSGKTLFFQAMLALELLQNKFLLDRIAVARGLPNEQRLLNTALEMMDITIMFWTKRDHLMGFCCHFDWFITCYGVPSAGVLCVELLKQTKQPHESRVIFSRSDAIQKLTMFLGFLEWIRPTDGNFELAGRLRKVVRRILDYVLEPPQLEQQEEEVRGSVSDDFTNVDFGLDQTLSLDEMDCLDWLNTVDWTQGPWMEVN